MIKENSQIVQAFPIKASTYVGTPTNLDLAGYSIVHVNADAILTFDFGLEGQIVITALAGSDFAIDEACETLTATAECLVS